MVTEPTDVRKINDKMTVERVSIDALSGAGACSFCDRASLNQSKNGLTYPYKETTKISSRQTTVFYCDMCREETAKIFSDLNKG